jgi:hypothetical protein
MEAKAVQRILYALYFRTAFYITADLARTLVLTARRALDRSCDATPRRAPVGDAAVRINLSIFACWEHKMFRVSRWKPICPVAQSCQSGWRKRSRPSKSTLGLAFSYSQHAALQIDSVNLIWPTLITHLATPWVNQLPHPGRSEALRRP